MVEQEQKLLLVEAQAEVGAALRGAEGVAGVELEAGAAGRVKEVPCKFINNIAD